MPLRIVSPLATAPPPPATAPPPRRTAQAPSLRLPAPPAGRVAGLVVRPLVAARGIIRVIARARPEPPVIRLPGAGAAVVPALRVIAPLVAPEPAAAPVQANFIGILGAGMTQVNMSPADLLSAPDIVYISEFGIVMDAGIY